MITEEERMLYSMYKDSGMLVSYDLYNKLVEIAKKIEEEEDKEENE